MNIWQFPFALLAFLSLVLAMPIVAYYLQNHTAALTTEASFLAGLVPVALAALFIAGWIDA